MNPNVLFRETAGQQTAPGPVGAMWIMLTPAAARTKDSLPGILELKVYIIFITNLCFRFPNNPWSYEACATPLPVAVGPIAPSAAFTAPVGPSYGQNIPTYGHPASGPISSGFGSSGYGSGYGSSGYGSGYGSGFGSGYGSAGSLYGSNLGTLQPYGK